MEFQEGKIENLESYISTVMILREKQFEDFKTRKAEEEIASNEVSNQLLNKKRKRSDEKEKFIFNIAK